MSNTISIVCLKKFLNFPKRHLEYVFYTLQGNQTQTQAVSGKVTFFIIIITKYSKDECLLIILNSEHHRH